MPSDKTKKLLEGLGKITASKSNPVPLHNTRVFLPETNRMWKSVIDSYAFPKSYNKAKWNKVTDADGEVDYWTPYDRVYGGMYGERLIQKDGTEYLGKLLKKRRLVTGKDSSTGETKNFYSKCLATADGRWFDNCGMPIDPPKQEDQHEEEQKEEVGFAKRELTEDEKAEQAKWKQRAESDMLANLK